jgi:hypothetical protein
MGKDKGQETGNRQTTDSTTADGAIATCAPEELPRQWRQKAAEFKNHALESLAATYELVAAQLEHALAHHRDLPLSLRQAAREGGYSETHLGRLVAEGAIPNAGRKHAPRIRRRDVPLKRGHLAQRSRPQQLSGTSRSQIARSIVNRKDRGTR